MKIAVHQMCSGIQVPINTQEITKALRVSAAENAIMYFAPEMSFMLDRDRQRAALSIMAEKDNPMLQQICAVAAAEKIWVHLGSIPILHEDGSGRYGNRTIVIDSDGIIRARYDKMHLFDVDLATGESWRESSAYRGGDGPVLEIGRAHV